MDTQVRILFATDGSEDSAAAEQMLESWSPAERDHRWATGGPPVVTVLTVVPPLSLFAPELIAPTSGGWAEVPLILERQQKDAEKISGAAAQRLREHGVAAENRVAVGQPVEEILQAVATEAADLVVLGSHGQSRLRQLLIGSVSQNVAKHARCSALVVRDTAPWRGRLLLAIDGSPESETAARSLTGLPLPKGQECTVLHVLAPILESGDPQLPQRVDAAEHMVEKNAAMLDGAGFRTTPLVQEGHAAQEILRAAREIGADLIVVGARGLSGLQEFLLGSVSARVLRYAPCSVLIAR